MGVEHQVAITAAGRAFGRMVMVGDTGGGDISVDANCNCDTRINSIVLEPVSLTLRRR
jgi:hypothetical protein